MGRFAKTDSNYDYSRGSKAKSRQASRPTELQEVQDKGGLLLRGFPQGCAYATMNEPLPDHFLGFGRMNYVGSSWVFEYKRQAQAAPLERAEVALNLGLMGQDPEGSVSVEILTRTPRDDYIVAQLLDRSDLNLPPIVTCISPVFRGRLCPTSP